MSTKTTPTTKLKNENEQLRQNRIHPRDVARVLVGCLFGVEGGVSAGGGEAPPLGVELCLRVLLAQRHLHLRVAQTEQLATAYAQLHLRRENGDGLEHVRIADRRGRRRDR